MILPKKKWLKEAILENDDASKMEVLDNIEVLDGTGMKQLADELEALVFIPVDDKELADFKIIIKFLRGE